MSRTCGACPSNVIMKSVRKYWYSSIVETLNGPIVSKNRRYLVAKFNFQLNGYPLETGQVCSPNETFN